MRIIFLIIFLTCGILQGQNLVPNPSFEDTVMCPTTIGQLNKAQFWVNPTSATPDYFNSCNSGIYIANVPYTPFGYQAAVSGVALAGFYAFNKSFPNVREYVQTKLTDTLTVGHKYLISFYVNLSNFSQYSLSSLGAYLSSTAPVSSGTVVMSYNPQIQNNPSSQLTDTLNWMLISDTLLSAGTEQYITIGNFNVDSQSDTLFKGSFGGNNIAYYYIDDVSVIDVASLGVPQFANFDVKIYPNPTTDALTVEAQRLQGKIRVFDILGNEVMNTTFSNKKILDIKALNSGMYYLRLISDKEVISQAFVKE